MRSVEEARGLLERHVGDLALETIEPLAHAGWGGDSDVFLVDRTHVFRIARFEPIRRLYEMEARFLPRLAARLAGSGVAVPAFTHVGRVPDGPPLFVGYRAIEGRALTAQVLEEAGEAARERIAAQLAGFLTRLHTFPLEEAAACGVEAPRIPLREQITRQQERIRRLVYPQLDGEGRRFLEGVFARFFGEARLHTLPMTVCHGDLGVEHILVRRAREGDWKVAGVVDWSDVRIGDGSGDFYWRADLGEAGEGFFRRVVERYEGPAKDKAALAEMLRLRMGFVPTAEIAYGVETSTPAYVEEGRARLAEAMRRWEGGWT